MKSVEDRPRPARRGARLGAGALVLCALFASRAAAQDVEAQEERAQRRISELFELRVDLLLADLGANTELPEGRLDEARSRTHEAVGAFMQAHPVKLQHQGPISWQATPIEHEPFAVFLESEEWRAAAREALSEAEQELLAERIELRRDRLRAALAGLLDAQLARGLCLTEGERTGLAEVYARAAEAQLEAGVVGRQETFYFGQEQPDELLELVEEAGLREALAGPRRALFDELSDEGRTHLHDYLLEAEFLLQGREDPESPRRLLYGCAEALVHRDGRQPKKGRQALVFGRDLSGNEFWNRALRGVLTLPEDQELPELPSRSVAALIEARAQFLLAVLDERAVFSAEQRESLLPLMVKFVEKEVGDGKQTTRGMTLTLPAAFRVSVDGLLIPGENRFNQPSTSVKAMIKTFYEVCSQDQREVLGA